MMSLFKTLLSPHHEGALSVLTLSSLIFALGSFSKLPSFRLLGRERYLGQSHIHH